MKQSDKFRGGEANALWQRSQKHRPETGLNRLLNEVWARLPTKPRRFLEIGCQDGHNGEALARAYPMEVHGLDPAAEAVAAGMQRNPALKLQVGTADSLPFADGFFDAVMFGFCLYLCDRGDLFKIAAEADRVLQAGGYLVVVDFMPGAPYRNRYSHLEDTWSYKMDYSRMFLWNPAYSLVEYRAFSHSGEGFHPHPNERVGLHVLHKAGAGDYVITDPYG